MWSKTHIGGYDYVNWNKISDMILENNSKPNPHEHMATNMWNVFYHRNHRNHWWHVREHHWQKSIEKRREKSKHGVKNDLTISVKPLCKI